MKKKLTLSKKDKVFFGVCGGLAKHLNVDAWLIRVVFACIPALRFVYLLLAAFLEDEKEPKK